MLAACGKQTVTTVAGNYEGKYFGGIEKFTLTPDGKFTQSLKVNGKTLYTNQGTWTLTGRNIRFQNFIKAYWFTDKDFSNFKKPLDEFNAKMPVGTNAIVFSEDGDYFVRKK
jgi:hypothetical protein